ncbi:MAG: hypothetical protein BWX54_01518 [Verrucomicrobia bacterium ADurb.Bin018]|nr:MAG: hypothetical protein BWX54_01518 [Verrucomicrobia bacterium ADurb.Bin018]
MHGLEARQRVFRRCAGTGHRVANHDFGGVFNVGEKIAHLPRLQDIHRLRTWIEDADLLHFVIFTGPHQPDAIPAPDGAIKNAHINNAATERVVFRVKNEGPQVARILGYRRRDALHQRFQHLRHPHAGFGADVETLFTGNGEHIFNLPRNHLRFGRRHVGFVQHWDNLDVRRRRKEGVRHRLRLHPLRGVHHQERPFTRRQTATDFIRKIHVPRGINEIELIHPTVARDVFHGHRMRLDGDATLAFQVHVVQQLVALLALGHRAGQFQQPVGERRFAVVNVRNDAEIADQRQIVRRPRRGCRWLLGVGFGVFLVKLHDRH